VVADRAGVVSIVRAARAEEGRLLSSADKRAQAPSRVEVNHHLI